MSFEPREQDDIYNSLKDRLTGRITKLTNFTTTSFNWVWTQAFAAEFREQELDATAAYLSGLIDYAGGPVTQENLEELGIYGVATAEEINSRLNDEDLDELVKIVGIDRNQGSAATGTVTFTTQSGETTIPAGTSVGTQPDNSGDFFEFETNEEVSTNSGTTTVDAPITAVEVGDEYEVGSGQISYLPDPPSGVQRVSNTQATSGGEDVESNDELRERAKKSIFSNSGGGTVEGVKGFINENVEGVDEVEITEFFTGDAWHGSYPHSHVIVSGGDTDSVLDAIESSRPVAVQHVLIRPRSLSIRVDLTLQGSDINVTRVKDKVKEYIGDLGLNDSVIDTKIIQRVMNADTDIEDIETMDLFIENESTFFDNAQDTYELSKGDIMQNDGIQNVEGTLNGSPNTFVEDTDYQEWNTTAGDTSTPHNAIDWSLSGDEPDILTGEVATETFESGKEKYIIDDAMITDGITSVEGILNGSTHTFTEGTDFEETDVRVDGVINGIDWSIGGDSPDDATDFTVTYDSGTPFKTTYILDEGTDIDFDKGTQPVAGTVNVSIL